MSRPRILFDVVVLAGIALGLVLFAGCTGRDEALRKSGIEAPAVILSVEQTNTRYNDDWVFRLGLKVMPENLPPYQTVVSEPFRMIHVPDLHVGGTVTVKYDPENPKKVTVMATGGALPSKRGKNKQENWSMTGCFCVAEGKDEDRRVQLAVSIEDNGTPGPFKTDYRLHVGDKEYDLAVDTTTAPSSELPSRSLSFTVSCTSDRVVVAMQSHVTAWSLADGQVLWSTKLERKLNLLGSPAPEENYSITCRKIRTRKGKVAIPLGKRKKVRVDVATGKLKKR